MNLKGPERTQLLGKMGVAVAKDCQGKTLHVVSCVHRRGPVFYTSMPFGTSAAETLKGDRTNRAEDKHRLVSTLWGHLVAIESPLWKRSQSSSKSACPIKVVRGLLGRPHLLLGKYRGPAISFSEGGGKLWAALCGDESDIGIDVAGTDEFQRDYPFHRVFHLNELHHALRLTSGNMENASALLWSIKEAVVKALGCGFHLVDPREIYVHPSVEGSGGHTFSVCLSGKTLVKFPNSAGRPIWVRSILQEKTWLSIALMNWQHRCGDA